MSDILNVLNQNSGAITALATVALVAVTICYVVYTKRLVETHTNPRISVYTQISESGDPYVEMVVENTGLSPAYNLKFALDKDGEYSKGKFFKQLKLFERGTKSLASNQKRIFNLGLARDFLLEGDFIEFDIEYENAGHKRIKERGALDFSGMERAHTLVSLGASIGDIASQVGFIPICISSLQRTIEDLKKALTENSPKT